MEKPARHLERSRRQVSPQPPSRAASVPGSPRREKNKQTVVIDPRWRRRCTLGNAGSAQGRGSLHGCGLKGIAAEMGPERLHFGRKLEKRQGGSEKKKRVARVASQSPSPAPSCRPTVSLAPPPSWTLSGHQFWEDQSATPRPCGLRYNRIPSPSPPAQTRSCFKSMKVRWLERSGAARSCQCTLKAAHLLSGSPPRSSFRGQGTRGSLSRLHAPTPGSRASYPSAEPVSPRVAFLGARALGFLASPTHNQTSSTAPEAERRAP